MLKCRTLIGLLAAGGAFVLGGSVSAEDESFYENKRIIMVVGFNPGGGFDSYARAVVRHWTNHVPGKPDFIVQNMPGAGSLKAAQHLYKVAEKDGTVLGAVNGSLAGSLLLRPSGVNVDLRRFNWIGSPSRITMVGVAWHTAPAQSPDALRTTELIVGGAGSATVMLPRAAQEILGLKFKVITGYRGTKGIMLAMERGEVQGAVLSYSSFKSGYGDWIEQKKARIFAQFGLTTNSDIPKVPKLMEIAQTERQRQALGFVLGYQEMGRPYVAPPGVPAKRVALLRKSFNATVRDRAFIEEASKRRLDVVADFPTGEDLQTSVEEIYATPPEIVDYVRSLNLRGRKGKSKRSKK